MTRLEAHSQELDRPAAELAAAALTLARSFAAGATMWCVAPEWPSHARHVAVEFVHPVIVGKKALPARNLEGAEAESALRLLARPRDVLLLVGVDGDSTDQLISRAEAWGVTRIWLGLGRRPATSRADHLVWSETDNPDLTAHSGDMVLLYHLLWELTHVVFEHPGLLAPESDCVEEVCITCSDEGRVAEVRSVRSDGLVDVIVQGVPERVDASLVDPVRPGDLVLIHAGVALAALGGDRS